MRTLSLVILSLLFGQTVFGGSDLDCPPGGGPLPHIYEIYPMAGDFLWVRIDGTYTPCWSVVRDSCYASSDSTFHYDIFLEHDEDPSSPCNICSPCVPWIPYLWWCDLGILEAGIYHFTATEYHDSDTYPESCVAVRIFEVFQPSPVIPSTWGMMKERYRDGEPPN
jgi:hypothetical protein